MVATSPTVSINEQRLEPSCIRGFLLQLQSNLTILVQELSWAAFVLAQEA